MWDSAVVTSGDGGCGDGRVGARGLRPEGSQYTQNSQCECILSLLGSTAASNVNSMRNALLMNFYVEFRICKQQKENHVGSLYNISVITQGDYLAVALVSV